jgi:hypothetical protein
MGLIFLVGAIGVGVWLVQRNRSQPRTPPPGWYNDPRGEHASRWWDGQQWTEWTR